MNRIITLSATGCILALGLSACGTAENVQMTLLEQELKAKSQEVEEQDAMLMQKAEENKALEAQLAELRGGRAAYTPASGSTADLPPNAQPGHCYARVFVPATYQTKTERVLDTAESERIEVTPATYDTVEERVLVREASERIEVVPATYKTVEERIMVTEASERLISVPAVYGTEEERILVRPAYTTWKKGRGPVEKIDEATGEIMCLVEVPAEYKTVSKRVLQTPATTRVEKIPATYKTVTRQVVDKPATTRAVKIPAEYRTVKVRKLASPAKENRVTIPATYQTVTKRELVGEGKLDWREILCETNTTPGVIQRLQQALRGKGYNPGNIDGVLGPDTMQAITAYQRANNLESGQLTMKTLDALKVKL